MFGVVKLNITMKLSDLRTSQISTCHFIILKKNILIIITGVLEIMLILLLRLRILSC